MASDPVIRFADLVDVSAAPTVATPAERIAVDAAHTVPELGANPQNSGFVTGLFRRRRVTASRRTFLRGGVTAAGAAAAGLANLFGPARTVEAQTGVIGTYPRRILQYCPPYNSGDNCQPGCGSSPICTDCCSSDGYFRNEPQNGYSLYPGGCGDGDIADGWLWRYAGACGNCSTIEYRCSDGYVNTDTGPAPFICRVVVDCVPLAEGQEPGADLPDAARPTNWRPAGSLELAVDNGGTVSFTGWMADGSGNPLTIRLRANDAIILMGTAGLSRPDIAGRVRGAGPNTGYAVTVPIGPGDYRFCIDALSGSLSANMGCVDLSVGSGQRIQGPSSAGTISAPVEQTADTGPPPPTATPTPVPTPTPIATLGALALPEPSAASPSPPFGVVEVLRRHEERRGFVSGWAGDVDSIRRPYVEVSVEGIPVGSTRAWLPRPDIATAFPGLGPETGFAVAFPIPSGEIDVCIHLIAADDGQRVPLGCRTLGAALTPADHQSEPTTDRPQVTDRAPSDSGPVVYGRIEATVPEPGTVTVNGWAFDPNQVDQAVDVRVQAGSRSATVTADQASPHITDRFGLGGGAGFASTLELAAGSHTVELISEATGAVLDTSAVQVEPPPPPEPTAEVEASE